MLIALLAISIALYTLSAVQMLRSFSAHANLASATALVWQRWLPLVALLSHAALILLQLQRDHFDHLNIASSLSVVAWLLALFSVLRGQRASSLLLRPVVFLFAAVSVILMVATPVDWGAAIAPRSALIAHIVLSLLAYGVLLLATLYAIQLLYLTRILKQRKANSLARHLPPLLSVEHYFFRLISAGTFLLAAAIASGFIFLDDMLAQGQAHKTVLSSIALALYLSIVIVHKFRGVRGRAIVVSAVVASIILTLGYFGSRFVKDVILAV